MKWAARPLLFCGSVMRDPGNRLNALIGPAVEGLGYEFVGVEYMPRRQQSLLRVYIDSGAGISLDDCARVSDQLSGLLDVENPIHGAYSLEVSSPGLDRPLFFERHFERFRGAKVRVKMGMPVAGRRNFKGTLDGCRDGDVILFQDGEEHALPLEDISTARLIPEN
ncbi:MAG: ribosome maturation factor RimP [Gammaproteobacteria bacterium]|nr:MAG: ribosome maturation factor RimP [Gammaproteobacteria bacterium]